MMSEQTIQWLDRLQFFIGYRFQQPNLAFEALPLLAEDKQIFHNSVSLGKNSRLAFVGYNVLRLVLAQRCHSSGGKPAFLHLSRTNANNANPAHPTRYGEEVTRDKSLSVIGRRCGIDALIAGRKLSSAEFKRIMGTTMKAILGSVWLDCRRIEQVEDVMCRLGIARVGGPWVYFAQQPLPEATFGNSSLPRSQYQSDHQTDSLTSSSSGPSSSTNHSDQSSHSTLSAEPRRSIQEAADKLYHDGEKSFVPGESSTDAGSAGTKYVGPIII